VLTRGLPFEIKLPPMTRAEAEAIFFDKIREAEESFASEPSMTIDELESKLGV
jgi:hypothetical protein